jgi:hypothetical protein
MLRFWLTPVLALSLLFAITISAVNARPYDNPDLRAFLQAAHECTLPCWGGIRPGVTGLSEIQIVLGNHEWVREVTFTPTTGPDTGFMTWRWRDPVTGVIDATQQGEAGISDGVVTWLQIPTVMAFGDVWLTMGPPQRGRTIAGRRPAYMIRHYAAYADQGVQVRYAIPCAWNPDHLWRTRVNLWLGIRSVVQMPDYVRPPHSGCRAP